MRAVLARGKRRCTGEDVLELDRSARGDRAHTMEAEPGGGDPLDDLELARVEIGAGAVGVHRGAARAATNAAPPRHDSTACTCGRFRTGTARSGRSSPLTLNVTHARGRRPRWCWRTGSLKCSAIAAMSDDLQHRLPETPPRA